MTDEEIRAYFLNKPAAWLDFPFGDDVCVFKVKAKMFATLGWEQDVARINLKCDPEEAVMLRDVFDAVKPGYHMNKTHWNTVIIDGSLPAGEIRRMIDNSYALVAKSLRRAERTALEVKFGKPALYGAAQ
jgi:predicted DNA-binding protein (MmcQ/YjbR family)